MPSAIISLTTDFGTSDWYVGAMKGVVLSINPDAAVVDISHDIPPQDIAHGAFVLSAVCRDFPSDTIHVAVIDPGVGTSRRALLVDTPAGRFVAPDNGLLTYVLADQRRNEPSGTTVGIEAGGFLEPLPAPVPQGCSAYALTRAEYWRHPVSDTFHGRDVFAPVAAHLSRGVPAEELGDAVGEVVCLSYGPPASKSGVTEGRVIFVDHFGNLVTNIHSSGVPGGVVEVEISGTLIKGLRRTFAEGSGLLALVGSHGYLEIAETNGSAADRLAVGVGSVVRLLSLG